MNEAILDMVIRRRFPRVVLRCKSLKTDVVRRLFLNREPVTVEMIRYEYRLVLSGKP